MVTINEEIFEDMHCFRLENEDYTLWLTRDFGPRIIGCAIPESGNLFAVLPDEKIPVKGKAEYSLRGGHRLWYAPERPEATYITDDLPPSIQEMEYGLDLIQEVDQPTGIQKSISVSLDAENHRVVIDHFLTNQGKSSFELAPWAITMLRPGGVGLLPLRVDNDDQHGLWPNRQLAFWPYTDLQSPHLEITNQGVYVKAEMKEGALKIGIPNPYGWIAYQLDEFLFIKRSVFHEDKQYLDRRASHQVYCNQNAIELETLGPLVNLSPGEVVNHREVWQAHLEADCPDEFSHYFQLLSK